MAELEDRVTSLETRVDELTAEVTKVTDVSVTAASETRKATHAHHTNIVLLNALRDTQAEHGRILADHSGRLDSIDGKLGQLALGMHTIEPILRRISEQG